MAVGAVAYPLTLKQQSADVVRKILAPVVSNDDCLDVMIKNKDNVIQLVNDAGDDASDFKDVVRQKVIVPGCSSEVVEFARAIGVETPDDAMEDEPEQEEH